MIKNFYKKLSTLALCLMPSIAFATFTITPINVVIDPANKIANMSLKNDAPEARTFELNVFKVSVQDGREVLTPSDDLLVTPRNTALKPSKTQTIRLSIKDNVMYSKVANGYKISIKELPRKMNVKGSHVQLLSEFQVPVTISDAAAKTDVAE